MKAIISHKISSLHKISLKENFLYRSTK